MPYAPQVQDISGQIRAQGMVRSSGQLRDAVLGAADAYKKNKEMEKEMAGYIKSAEGLISAIGPLSDKIDPKVTQAINDIQQRITDPNLSTRERAAIARNSMDGIGMLLNTGIKTKELEQENARQQAMDAQRQAQMQARAQQEAFKQAVEQAAQMHATGQPLPQGLPPQILNAAIVRASELTKAGTEEFERMGTSGMTEKVRRNNLTGREQATPQLPPGMMMAQGAQGAPSLAPIPGTEMARKREEEALQKQDEEAKAKERAEGLKTTAKRAYDVVQKAKALVSGGFLAQGMGSTVGGAFGGTPGADLESAYKTLKADLALSQIADLKELSKSGSTGLGSVSNIELENLQSRLVNLNRDKSDKLALEDLTYLEKFLREKFKDVDFGAASDDKGSARAKSGKAPSTGRFKIVEVK